MSSDVARAVVCRDNEKVRGGGNFLDESGVSPVNESPILSGNRP